MCIRILISTLSTGCARPTSVMAAPSTSIPTAASFEQTQRFWRPRRRSAGGTPCATSADAANGLLVGDHPDGLLRVALASRCRHHRTVRAPGPAQRPGRREIDRPSTNGRPRDRLATETTPDAGPPRHDLADDPVLPSTSRVAGGATSRGQTFFAWCRGCRSSLPAPNNTSGWAGRLRPHNGGGVRSEQLTDLITDSRETAA